MALFSAYRNKNQSISYTLFLLALGFGAVSCNKPPSRSYIVKAGDLDASPEIDHPESVEQGEEPEEIDNSAIDETEGGLDRPGPIINPKPDIEKPTVDGPVKMDPPKDTTTETPKPDDTKKLIECPNNLSVGRIHQWHATSEGVMIPQSGLIVVKEGAQNVAKVEFVGEGWHVVPVWLKNAYEAEVDLSKSKNFVITYSATADLYVQLRPSFAWSGGDKWAAKIPSTGGVSKTLTVSFEEAAQWTAPLGQPPHTLNEARAKARGFVFIGNKPAKFAVTSLVIDGYEPPCP